MLMAIYQNDSTPQATSLNPFHSPIYEAHVAGPGIDWNLTGKLTSGFEIRNAETGKLLAIETHLSKRTWTLESKTKVLAELSQTLFLQRFQWGPGKQPLEMFLREDDTRGFAGDGFEVLHHDFQSDLEIHFEDRDGALRGAWFCFWYWQRKSAMQANGKSQF